MVMRDMMMMMMMMMKMQVKKRMGERRRRRRGKLKEEGCKLPSKLGLLLQQEVQRLWAYCLVANHSPLLILTSAVMLVLVLPFATMKQTLICIVLSLL
jgi:hypothetical protein